MFRDRDLSARVLGTLLPAAMGERVSAALTMRLGGMRARYAASVAGAAAAELLGDAAAGQAVERRWVASLALDDLEACRAWARRDPACGDATVEGGEHLPPPGAGVFASFHLSGGLAIFETLHRRGFAPTFLLAPEAPHAGRYERAIRAIRLRYLTRILERPCIETGRGARQALEQHLDGGGAVVALLDVPEDAVQLRDRATGELFGRAAHLPVGILRLAVTRGLPVVPYDCIVANGSRTVRFYPSVAGAEPQEVLHGVLAVMERVVREHPWDWHSWLELDALLAPRVT
jgi:hypothetical protein